ncbi:hypothetical protein HDU93_002081 [Gonapodya sp. JEL0774]|nr:hypothetical protein HDU93_002081 [Gonapodya sp. JEL0774]
MAAQNVHQDTLANNVIPNYLNEVVDHLASLDALLDNIDIQVPAHLVDAVDHGRNPDLYTKHLFETVAAQNARERGKIDAVKRPGPRAVDRGRASTTTNAPTMDNGQWSMERVSTPEWAWDRLRQ